MNSITELNCRIMSSETSETSHGILSADAEITVRDGGRTVCLHGQWISECDGIFLEATHESVYDVYEKLNSCSEEEFDGLCALRDRICAAAAEDPFLADIDAETRYAAQFEKIKALLTARAEELGYEFFGEEDE